ncbi:MAG: hypothetical protein ACRD22_20040 [Terriglobia bacterium]
MNTTKVALSNLVTQAWAQVFHNLRRFPGRFPGFLSPEHADRALGLYLLGAENV